MILFWIGFLFDFKKTNQFGISILRLLKIKNKNRTILKKTNANNTVLYIGHLFQKYTDFMDVRMLNSAKCAF